MSPISTDRAAGGNDRVKRVISLPASVQRRESYRIGAVLEFVFFYAEIQGMDNEYGGVKLLRNKKGGNS